MGRIGFRIVAVIFCVALFEYASSGCNYSQLFNMTPQPQCYQAPDFVQSSLLNVKERQI